MDISLYKDESQIESKTPAKRKLSETKQKRNSETTKKQIRTKTDAALGSDNDDDDYKPSKKRAKTAKKNSPKKAKSSGKVNKLTH